MSYEYRKGMKKGVVGSMTLLIQCDSKGFTIEW